MSNVQNLKKEIEELAVSWGEALKIGNHRKANKNNGDITEIAKRFKKDKDLGESILIPLLRHSNPSVRLIAAVHALDLELHVQESEDALTKIANDPSIRVIRLMAQINLTEWNKKKSTKIVQKDQSAD